MLNKSVAYYMGDFASQHAALYAEKVLPMLDWVLSNDYMFSEQMNDCFNSLINKYQNTQDLPYEEIVEVINESGYGYILDLLSPDTETVKVLVYLLVLIHMLKGSRKGLEIVLSLFAFVGQNSNTVITEWFEVFPIIDEENTFTVESTVDVNKLNENFFANFSNFIKQYVYPELKEFKCQCVVEASSVYIPLTQLLVYYNSVANFN
jgi:hypothetical protein